MLKELRRVSKYQKELFFSNIFFVRNCKVGSMSMYFKNNFQRKMGRKKFLHWNAESNILSILQSKFQCSSQEPPENYKAKGNCSSCLRISVLLLRTIYTVYCEINLKIYGRSKYQGKMPLENKVLMYCQENRNQLEYYIRNTSCYEIDQSIIVSNQSFL